MSTHITFYDLTRTVPSDQSPAEIGWSPNTLKTRLGLAIKGLPFKTEWLQWLEIEPKSEGYNLPAKVTGIPYILPVIVDNKTGRVVRESLEIAKYLDEQYPDTPRLIPEHSAALQAVFVDQVAQPLVFAIFPVIINDILAQCDEKNAVYFRESRARLFGVKYEDLLATGEARVAKLNELKALLDKAATWIAHNGEGAVFVNGGDKPAHADTALAGVFLWTLRVVGKEHEVSKIILTANEGRWEKYLAALSPYLVDN